MVADDVEIYTSPWVAGTRAEAYFGPVRHVSTFTRAGDGGEAVLAALDALRKVVFDLGGNSLIGIEIVIEWRADGFRLEAMGTAAKLEALFP